MLLYSDEKSTKFKELIDMIIQKTPILKHYISKKKESNKNILVEDLVEKSVEIRKIASTTNAVIITKKNFLTLENDTFNSTNPQENIKLYNSFLIFCWNNKSNKNLIPESKVIETALDIKKPIRLELQTKAINNSIFEQSKNNKTFFSKDIKSIEEVLKSK